MKKVKLYKKEIDFIDKSFKEYMYYIQVYGKAGHFISVYRKYKKLLEKIN